MWSNLNESQKDKILKLKSSGRSYKEIASALSISEGTVKSFFSRKRLKSDEEVLFKFMYIQMVEKKHRK